MKLSPLHPPPPQYWSPTPALDNRESTRYVRRDILGIRRPLTLAIRGRGGGPRQLSYTCGWRGWGESCDTIIVITGFVNVLQLLRERKEREYTELIIIANLRCMFYKCLIVRSCVREWARASNANGKQTDKNEIKLLFPKSPEIYKGLKGLPH